VSAKHRAGATRTDSPPYRSNAAPHRANVTQLATSGRVTRKRGRSLAPLPIAGRLGGTGRAALAVALVIALATHGYKLFGYPLYLTDEGIYTEQAWSVLHQGRLSPYTYFYDHAPMGWLVLSAWAGMLPKQFHTFGNPINAGRVLVTLLHLASVFFLFEVVRRYSGRVSAAFLSAFAFTVSPLSVYYQRQVLLDNMMVFWMLLGLYLIARRGSRVVTVMGAGLALGLAMITKENAVFLVPGFAYLMHHSIAGQGNRRFSASFWWFAAFAPVGVYVLFAELKNELLPQGMHFNLNSPPANHVSLLYTIWWQLNRTSQTSQGLAFADLLRGSWLPKDRFLIICGAVATGATLVLYLQDRRRGTALFGASLLSFGYGFYLARSVLLDFYVTPLIPLLALNIGLLWGRLTESMRPFTTLVLTMVLMVPPLALPGGYLIKYNERHTHLQFADQYRLALTSLQARQLAWIRANIPPDSYMIIDDDIWVALHDQRPRFRNAHSHYKASADPDVRDKVFHSDWRRLSYVVMSNRMRRAMNENNGSGQENWILQAIDEHGRQVWQLSKGNVELSIVKIESG
jgi:4-amino-4-deoxy-L-arabinose transferase-like glycosyltransferase